MSKSGFNYFLNACIACLAFVMLIVSIESLHVIKFDKFNESLFWYETLFVAIFIKVLILFYMFIVEKQRLDLMEQKRLERNLRRKKETI